jgi:isopentenyl-diphosphate Delta-isomerase
MRYPDWRLHVLATLSSFGANGGRAAFRSAAASGPGRDLHETLDIGATQQLLCTCRYMSPKERFDARRTFRSSTMPPALPLSGAGPAVEVVASSSLLAEGRLAATFSVFVFRSDGRMLLQRKAGSTRRSAGLWSNTCSGHPAPDEPLECAAHRRLRQEMGIDCELRCAFGFVYRDRLSRGPLRYTFDQVLVGRCDRDPSPDPHDVVAWRDVYLDELAAEIATDASSFAIPFLIALSRFVAADLSPVAGER